MGGSHFSNDLRKYTNMNAINPFGIVKANEFTIAQIVDNWVPLADSQNDFVAALNPQELMPKYVLGSKGCGKTHLLRYYSFEARMQRHDNKIVDLLKKDKYLASYSRLNSLSSARFNKQENLEEWQSLYNYYFELIQSIISLDVYKNVIEVLGVSKEDISKVISQVCKQVGINIECDTIDCLMAFLNDRRVTVDREIIDYPYSRKLNWGKVRPEFVFGTLLFEIPHCFSKYIDELRDVNYIYILDECEKLTCDWMKKSLNTLVYEKSYNVTFWVGSRKIGYTTRQTISGEPIHEGHEFNPVDLDALIKGNEVRFSAFATDLFKKRLKLQGLPDADPKKLFEEFDEKRLLRNLVDKAQRGNWLKHWVTFKERLEGLGLDESTIKEMKEMLCQDVAQDPVSQKIKLYSFYLKWAEKKNVVTKESIVSFPETINKLYEEYVLGNNKKMREFYNKFRQDMIAQLAEENKEPLYLYSGFDTLVKIADCNPRILLTLMKLIVEDCHFRGIDPFSDKKIPVRAQYVGINETAKWFLKDIEVFGEERENLDMAMTHLLNFMQVSRFCDKPTETSLCSFYYRKAVGQERIDRMIELACREAFLIEIANERKDKALGTPQKSYQVNRLIATVYKLPIARRGVTSIPPDMLKAIFDPEYFNTFSSVLMAHKNSLNAPFFTKKERKLNRRTSGKRNNVLQNQPSLFD